MTTPTRGTTPGAVQLAVVPEPVGLRHALRAVAEDCPGRAAELLVDPDGVAVHLWAWWHAPLEQAGMSRQDFLGIVAGYRPELWHWLWGDRTWAQCSQGLAGRLIRRTPAGGAHDDHPAQPRVRRRGQHPPHLYLRR